MGMKERLFHMVAFEVLALALIVPLSVWVTGKGAHVMLSLSIAMSVIAMFWNLVYNIGFDRVFGENRLQRGFWMRLFHGGMFELGLIFVSLPMLMLALQESFLFVLALDIGGVLFFLIYAIAFNWLYDVMRDRWVRRTANETG